MEVSPGFRSEHVLTGQIALPGKTYPSSETSLAFMERLTREVGEQPGVSAAGVVNNIPFSGHTGKSAATVKGQVMKPGESVHGIYSYGVDGDYFRAMGFVLREGRFLEAADSRRTERVCVVDEDFVRYFWPHADALGQRVFQGSSVGKDSEAFTVVGVVGSAKQAGLTDDSAQGAIYYPYVFRPDGQVFVVVRTGRSPESMRSTLQRVVRQIDSNLPVTDIQSMEARISDSLLARRSAAVLAALFSSNRSAADGNRDIRHFELRRGSAPPRNRCAHGPWGTAGSDPRPISVSRRALAYRRRNLRCARSLDDGTSYTVNPLRRSWF